MAFKFKFNQDLESDKVYFDESYIALLVKNTSIKIGRVNMWWSPSTDTSLILSYSSRPKPGIYISNYYPIIPKLEYFKFLGNIDYTFINQLEKNRHIPNTLLAGNRISFNFFDKLNFSLLRAAQFGGEGRDINLETIKNLILGKDNTNSTFSSIDQPGNQIAGIDFSYRMTKLNNLQIYGQYLGEDGLDPIIDDRWIGAIFPSKDLALLGLDIYYKGDHYNQLSVEYIDTDNGSKNTTYNHGIYKTGYRYLNKPIGASIDADSKRLLIKYKKFINSDQILNIDVSKNYINENNSFFNTVSNDFHQFYELKANYEKDYKVINTFIYIYI